MTDKLDPQDERHPPVQPPENDQLDAEQRFKLNRRKQLKLVIDFVIVIAFLVVLLVGFCLFIYKRMSG